MLSQFEMQQVQGHSREYIKLFGNTNMLLKNLSSGSLSHA